MNPGVCSKLPILFLFFFLPAFAHGGKAIPLPADYCFWQEKDYAIEKPLCNLVGDAQSGRDVVRDQHMGNCLACHQLPIEEEEFHGTLGPSLLDVGSRYTEGQLRLRIVDEQQINPLTVMPGFYRDPRHANRVADEYWGTTMLTAQQVEDVVAYLKTLQ